MQALKCISCKNTIKLDDRFDYNQKLLSSIWLNAAKNKEYKDWYNENIDVSIYYEIKDLNHVFTLINNENAIAKLMSINMYYDSNIGKYKIVSKYIIKNNEYEYYLTNKDVYNGINISEATINNNLYRCKCNSYSFINEKFYDLKDKINSNYYNKISFYVLEKGYRNYKLRIKKLNENNILIEGLNNKKIIDNEYLNQYFIYSGDNTFQGALTIDGFKCLYNKDELKDLLKKGYYIKYYEASGDINDGYIKDEENLYNLGLCMLYDDYKSLSVGENFNIIYALKNNYIKDNRMKYFVLLNDFIKKCNGLMYLLKHSPALFNDNLDFIMHGYNPDRDLEFNKIIDNAIYTLKIIDSTIDFNIDRPVKYEYYEPFDYLSYKNEKVNYLMRIESALNFIIKGIIDNDEDIKNIVDKLYDIINAIRNFVNYVWMLDGLINDFNKNPELLNYYDLTDSKKEEAINNSKKFWGIYNIIK